MQYITDLSAYQGTKRTAVTLGKFDGLHRGHQKLIDRIRSRAAAENLESVVFAFDMNRESLMTPEEKRHHLEEQVDTLIACPFTREIREMEAEAFIREILSEKLHAAYIAVGSDFHFGHEKRGDVKMLAEYAEQYGYILEIVEKEKYQERVISSTYIKEALKEGNVELAEKLLGYRYKTAGVVEHGKQLGRTLGFPTLNVAPGDKKIMPRFGVYACDVKLDGVCYHGIGNVGIKPTVSDEKRLLTEVYVFGYSGNAYGKYAEIEFCGFERPETTFHSVEELKEQVDKDILFGKNYFGECEDEKVSEKSAAEESGK